MKLTLNEIRPEVFELFIGGYRDSQGPVEYRQLYRASSVESEGHWVLLLAKETLSDRMQLTMGHTEVYGVAHTKEEAKMRNIQKLRDLASSERPRNVDSPLPLEDRTIPPVAQTRQQKPMWQQLGVNKPAIPYGEKY